MSGTLPTSPAPARADLVSHDPAFVSIAHSMRRITRSRGGHRWGLRLTYPPMERADWAPLFAFLVDQNGPAGTFTCTFPTLTSALGSGTGTPTVDSETAAGATTIATTWANLSTTVLKAGDLIAFSGGNKVYMVTADATTDGSGQVTVSIRPELHVTVAAAETVTYSSVPFQVALTQNALTVVGRSGSYFEGLVLDLIEVLD